MRSRTRTLDRDRVLAWATLDFVRRGQNLLIGGESGTGKSHIAIAIGYLACAAGLRARYTSSADILATLAASLATGTLADALKLYVRPDLLIIDEVGLDRPERDSRPDAQLFYKVIRARYDAPLSTIITSNIDWDAWGRYLGDDLATVAILDRLVHHGHLLTIKGPSYRAAQHSKLNARQPAAPRPSHGPAKPPLNQARWVTKPRPRPRPRTTQVVYRGLGRWVTFGPRSTAVDPALLVHEESASKEGRESDGDDHQRTSSCTSRCRKGTCARRARADAVNAW